MRQSLLGDSNNNINNNSYSNNSQTGFNSNQTMLNTYSTNKDLKQPIFINQKLIKGQKIFNIIKENNHFNRRKSIKIIYNNDDEIQEIQNNNCEFEENKNEVAVYENEENLCKQEQNYDDETYDWIQHNIFK